MENRHWPSDSAVFLSSFNFFSSLVCEIVFEGFLTLPSDCHLKLFIIYIPILYLQSPSFFHPLTDLNLVFLSHLLVSTVKVDCEPDVMQVHIKSNLLFGGKVYARDRPKSCFVDVGHSMDFTLPIRLYGDDCATSREVGKLTSSISSLSFSSTESPILITYTFCTTLRQTISEGGRRSNCCLFPDTERYREETTNEWEKIQSTCYFLLEVSFQDRQYIIVHTTGSPLCHLFLLFWLETHHLTSKPSSLYLRLLFFLLVVLSREVLSIHCCPNGMLFFSTHLIYRLKESLPMLWSFKEMTRWLQHLIRPSGSDAPLMLDLTKR